MRRVLLVIAILIVSLAIGCSRQPQRHVGEWWEEKFEYQGHVMYSKSYYFSDGDRIQFIVMAIDNKPIVREGRYKIDYSKDPMQIDVDWGANKQYGIIRFVGDGNNKMQILFDQYDGKRPVNFNIDRDPIWLTKKVKK